MKSDVKTQLKDPWVDLKYKKPSKKQEIEYNQTFRQSEKLKFFQRAFDFLYSNNINGDYFEFGVHTARTFRFVLRETIIKNMKMNFHAFDSFKGLPDHGNNSKQNQWYLKGLLSTSEKEFRHLISKYSNNKSVLLHKGLYEKTLDKNLISKFKKQNLKVSLINIDCDLEKSVEQSLDFALKFIQDGTILYIDDYYTTYKGHPKKGIPKIVKNLFKKNKIIYNDWHLVTGTGKSFLLYR